MTIESYILKIIEGENPAPAAKMLLRAMSHCYQAGISLRHLAYDWVIPTTKLSTPVVSIGNIVAGGTGKTPLVHYLAKEIGAEKVAILSRGYKRKSTSTLLVDETTPIQECGDEPLMLAKKLPTARIFVGANRVFTGRLAQTQELKCILLDDGMQHRRLHRDIEIAMMDAQDLFGKGYFLPRGLLRDHPRRLTYVDLILLNGVKDEAHFMQAASLLRQYSGAPITAMERVVENHSALANKKVGAFCAIAAPHRFTHTLKTLGCDIVLKQEKPDHAPFSIEELEQLSNQACALGAQSLVCTEKDAIKLPEKCMLSLPIVPVKIALTPTFGKEHLQNIIKRFK